MVTLFKIFVVHGEKLIPVKIAGVDSWPLKVAIRHAEKTADKTKLQTRVTPC